MCSPTNSNAPDNIEYSEKTKAQAAAFRPSISREEAGNMLVASHLVKTLNEKIEAKKRKTWSLFNSNPWSGLSSRTKGREFRLCDNPPEFRLCDNPPWRLIHFGKEHFLAKHIGDQNDFEYWHIKPPEEKPIPPNTSRTLVASTGTTSTMTVTMPNLPGGSQAPGTGSLPDLSEVDDWEDIDLDTL